MNKPAFTRNSRGMKSSPFGLLKLKNTKKNLKFFGMDLSINFDFFSIFLNLYSSPYPKIKIFFFYILNFLIRNSQISYKFRNRKTSKPKYSKN